MLRTLMAGFLARATLAALFYLVVFTLVFAKDQMTSSMLIGNARIDIRIEQSTLRIPTKDVLHWVKSAAESVAAYYGRFPRSSTLDSNHSVRRKRCPQRSDVWRPRWKNPYTRWQRDFCCRVCLRLDAHPRNGSLAFPSVDEKTPLIEEGIATYVEPIARIQAGNLTASNVA